MMSGRALNVWRQVPLFAALPDSALASMAEGAWRRAFRAWETIYEAGTPGNEIHLVLSGRVRLQRRTRSGQTLIVADRRPGDILDDELGPEEVRSSEAVALVPSGLLLVDRKALFNCLERSPAAALALIAYLQSELRESRNRGAGHYHRGTHTRVADAVLEAAERSHGAPGLVAGHVVRVTQRELAARANTTRESVNRVLRDLRRRGVLHYHGRQLVIDDAQGLRDLADPSLPS